MSTGSDVQQATQTQAVLPMVVRAIQSRCDTAVAPESTLESLALDSISMAEVTLEIETAFGIRTDDQLLDCRTVGDVARYVEKRAGK